MKSIYLFVLNLFIFVNINSQSPLLVPKINKRTLNSDNKVLNLTSFDFLSKSNSVTRGRIREKINAIDYMINFLGSTPYLAYTEPLFPDSNVIVAWSSGNTTPWLHGICQTFDLDGGYLKAPGATFDPAIQTYDTNGLTYIDTIWIQGYYARPNTSSVDTAIISIIADNHGNYTRAYNVGKPDSMIFVIDDKNRDNSPDSTIWTGKIILNASFKVDTLSNGGHMFVIAPNISISNCNGIVGISLEFKPGNNYSQATDTIFKNQNYISAVYATPQGQNTNFPLGQVSGDVTCGAFCDDSTKYSLSGFDYYLPPIAFTIDHTYQLYDISMKIRQGRPWSIKELDNGAKLFQNFPNPTNGNTSISYSLNNNATVSFEMMDVTGKVVLSQNEGNKTSGMHTITVNTSELTAGIYFYSVVVNNQKLTKKMSLIK